MSKPSKEKNALKRKDFLKYAGLTSIAVSPLVASLSRLFTNPLPPATLDKIISLAYRLNVPETLLNLELYFINVKQEGTGHDTVLKTWYGEAESYMIVRLPQQHIAEEFFSFEIDPEQLPSAVCSVIERKVYARTQIAGFSYLAFRILFEDPAHNATICEKEKSVFFNNERVLPFNIKALLDWNDSSKFKLVVRQNLEDALFESIHGSPGFESKFAFNGTHYTDSINNHYPFEKDKNAGSQFADSNLFPKVYGDLDLVKDKNENYEDEKFKHRYHLAINNIVRDAGPITLLEIPHKIFLSPKLPDQDNYRFIWKFSQRPLSNENSLQNSLNELWMAALTIERFRSKALKPATLEELQDAKPKEDMDLMILGHTHDKVNKAPFATLPNPEDAQDLVDLYKYQRITAKTQRLLFTPLGVTTSIHFKNNQLLDGNPPPIKGKRISLIEWNQQISLGRDEKVEVSRLVIDKETGHKFIWTRLSKRVTYYGAAILKYEEYLEPVGEEISHEDLNNLDATKNYTDKTYMAGSPFRKTWYKKERKRIKSVYTLNDAKNEIVYDGILPSKPTFTSAYCPQRLPGDDEFDTSKVLAFWAIDPITREVSYDMVKDDGKIENKKELVNADLTFEMHFTDWDNIEHLVAKKVCVMTLTTESPKTNLLVLDPKTQLATDAAENGVKEAIKDTGKIGDAIKSIDKMLKAFEPGTAVAAYDRMYRVFNHTVYDALGHYEKLLPHTINAMEQEIRKTGYAIADEWIDKLQDLITVMLEDFETALFAILDEINEISRRLLLADANLKKAIDNIIGYVLQGRDKILKDILQFRYIKANGSVIPITLYEGIITQFVDGKTITLAQLDIKKNDFYVQIHNYRKEILNHIGTVTGEELVKVNAVIDKLERLKTELDAYFTKAQNFYRNEKLPLRLISELKNLREFKNAVDVLAKVKSLDSQVRNKIKLERKKVTLVINKLEQQFKDEEERIRNGINEELSKLETEYITLRGSLRKKVEKDALDFFNQHACMPQLQTAKVYIKEVNDLVNKQIPVKLKYAEDYLKHQVDNTYLEVKENIAKTFAEIKGDTKARIKNALRELNGELAGVVNLEVAADYLSFAKKHVSAAENEVNNVLNRVKQEEQELANTINGIKDDLQKQGRDLVLMGQELRDGFKDYANNGMVEAQKILDKLNIKILGSIELKNIIADNFSLPTLIRDVKNARIIYNFSTEKLKEVSLGPFTFHNFSEINRVRNSTVFMIHMEKPLGPGQLGKYKAWAQLQNFSIGVFDDRLVVTFKKLSIYSDETVKNKTDVAIAGVEFRKELAFFKTLAQSIKMPAGLEIDIQPTGIKVGYSIPFPSITAGAFTMSGFKFKAGIDLHFLPGAGPMMFTLAINTNDDKFVVAVTIFGGRGHFVIGFTPKYVSLIDTAIDFGGIMNLDLGIAKGIAYLTAGIRYRYVRDDEGGIQSEFYAIISCGADVTVFGFISISIHIFLYLMYKSANGASTLEGVASISCSVKVGFFEKSFTLTYRKVLQGTDSSGGQAQGQQIAYNNATQQPAYSNAMYYAPHQQGLYTKVSTPVCDRNPRKLLVQSCGKASKPYANNYKWWIYCNSFCYNELT